MVADTIELGGPREGVGDVQALLALRVEVRRRGVGARRDRREARGRGRVGGGEEGHHRRAR